MKKFWKDFKDFVTRGNIIDLAVAVVIGGAFGKIVTSLVDDIIMPLISLAIGGAHVSDWKWVIKPATEATAETALRYGVFIQTILDFLIIAFFIFLAIRLIMNAKLQTGKFTTKMKSKRKKKMTEDDAATAITENTEAEAQIEQSEEKKFESQEEILVSIRDLLKDMKDKQTKDES